MRWPKESADPFPSPHRGEPANLRADILDELADHLALAVEDEVETNGQSQESAWTRALERFGNPDAIAMRLWWDAMKERVMRDWIQTGIAGISAIVVVLVGVFVVMNMRTMQATQVKLVEMLKDFDSRSQTPQGESLDIEVRRGTPEGPPAIGVRVELSGKLNADESARVVLETDAQGRVRFSPVAQGVYYITLSDPQSSMTLRESRSLFAGVGSKQQFIAPDLKPVQTRFALNPELPFPNDRMLVSVAFEISHKVGDFRWTRNGRFLVGHAGVYEISDAQSVPGPRRPAGTRSWDSFTNKLEEPVPTISLPPVELQLTKIQTAFRNPEGGFGLRSESAGSEFMHSQAANLVPDRDNVVTLELTDAEVKSAEELMMNYSARKWQPDRAMGSNPPVNAYVVAAIPIEAAAPVQCDLNGEDKANVTLLESKHDKEAAYSGEKVDWVILKLTDVENLVKSYPPECRFLVTVTNIESADVYPWKSAEWPADAGATFPLDLEKPVRLSNESNPPHADITPFIRGDAATSRCAGVLIHIRPAETGDNRVRNDIMPRPRPRPNPTFHKGIMLSTERQDARWATPHLLIVRDTPPDDL